MEYRSKSIGSGLWDPFITTLQSDIPQYLQQDVQSVVDLLWLTFPYIIALSIAVLWWFGYYYIWLPINWVQDLEDVGYQHLKDTSLKRKPKKELVEEVRRRRQVGELPPVYPNGWFALLESADLKAGQVKHVQALGENFAVMRSNKGEVHVLDAYCPHLGANMAVGGVVRGDCLECPFHGWQFRGEDGTCSHIPYSDKVVKSAMAKKWTSKELNDLVFVWYHAEVDPPSWHVQIIPEIESEKLWYRGRFEVYTNCHIQDVHENVADISHFGSIHKTSVFAGSDIHAFNRPIHNFLKHHWNLDWRQNSAPEESHMCTLSVKHCIKILNKFTLIPSDVTITQIGPGYSLVENDEFRTVITITPMEPLITRVVFRVYCPPRLFIFGGLQLLIQKIMFERDIMIWNHKRYVMNPILVKEDEAIKKHRRWSSQFYTANSSRFSF